MRRRLLTLLAPLALLSLLAVPVLATPAQAADVQARNPIVFVHGWNGSSSAWNTMISRLQADGYAASELFAWNYNSAQSNATTAQQLGQVVNTVLANTGATQVDLVSHSMGGLSTRHYVKFLGGATKVDDWISLGGPNHGTSTANLCFWNTSCFEMRPGSAFLTQLNSGDETPGVLSYTTLWSPCDEVINPDSSVPLIGANNIQTACVSHSGLLSDAGAYSAVRAAVG